MSPNGHTRNNNSPAPLGGGLPNGNSNHIAANNNNNNNNNNKNYIRHHVSNLDTLAGVAIKYGVEVADIKRLNGLATDLQMFALKTLLIPLPGRHPPSSVLSNGSSPSSSSPSSPSPSPSPSSASPSGSHGVNGIKKTPPRPRHSNVLDSFESLRLKAPQQKVSPAMSTLQKYYGLKSSNHNGAAEGTEMSVYRSGSLDSLSEGLLPKASPMYSSPYRNHKPRNQESGFLNEDDTGADYMPLAEPGDGEAEKSNEKSVRRRQKAEADSRNGTPERLLKEENSGVRSDFSPGSGKGLAMRRTLLSSEQDGWLNSIPVGLGDSILPDGLVRVHKSSSTPSLQEQDSGNSSSLWPTSKWSLKPDLQAISTAAINMPIFDGLPKPISGRKSKAALD